MNQNAWEALERAIVLATNAHCGQRDKAGKPYILHLIRVMESVEDPVVKQAAILHDYLEDVGGTVDDLKKNGISPDAIVAIQLLTRCDQLSYCEYVIAIRENEVARLAKLADIHDNYRIGRVAFRSGHEQEDSTRILCYALSHQFLRGELSEDEYRNRMSSFNY